MPDKLPTDVHVTDTPAPRPQDLVPIGKRSPAGTPASSPSRPSPIDEAVQATREAIARGERPMRMGEPIIEGGEPGPELESGAQARERLEKDARQEILESAGAELEAPADTAPVYNDKLGRWQDPATGKLVAQPEGTETPQEGLEAPATVQGAEGELEPAAGAQEGQEPTFVVVELPARREGEAPFELEVADQEAAERINQLKNGYMRGKDYYEKLDEVAAVRADFEEVGRAMATDPAGWLLANIPPEIKSEVAIRLLTDDAVYRSTIAEVNTWVENPALRAARAAELRADAVTREAHFEREQVVKQSHQAAARAVRVAMYDLVPEDASPADAQFFIDSGRSLVIERAKSTGKIVKADDVPELLAETYRRAFGVALPPPSGHENGHATRPRVKVPAAGEQRPPKNVAASSGERFSQQVQARKRAAAVAPAGAGSGGRPGEAFRSKPGETVQDALARARNLAAAGHIKFGGG